MKRKEFDPGKVYRTTTDGRTIYIDLNLDKYREIYDEWDFSPVRKRDLDGDLLEYLESCISEIPGHYKVVIVLNLPGDIQDEQKENLSTQGFQNFFRYQIRKLQGQQRISGRNLIIYGILGLAMIYGGYLSRNFFPQEIEFLGEGFFIGGWVLFWELFDHLFFGRGGVGQRLKGMKRLLAAPILYKYHQRRGEQE